MANLFTTYEATEAPPITTPETLQTLLEFQSYVKEPALEDLSDDIDWSFLESNIPTDKPLEIKPMSTEDSNISNLINNARQFVGSKYSWGGSNPSTGFDCSGLIQYVFKQAGVNLPRTAALQGKIGLEIDISQTKPGDIIWFGSKNSPSGLHIGLVSRIENGLIYIIDAAGKKLGVTERALPNLLIKSVRRIFGNIGSSFANQVMSFFTNKGLTESQARGILGNLMQESRGNHNIVNSKSGAFGLAQWLGSRKLKLKAMYGNNPTLQLQLEFIWEELNTTEKNAFLKLLNTNNVADATRAFANHFERAGKDEMNMNLRINYAYNA